MSIEKKIFAVNICSCHLDLAKRWFVKVKVPDFNKGGFTWKKCYGDINKAVTVPDRLAAAQELAQIITTTQNYKSVQGSRSIGYIYEGFVTDTLQQLQRRLNLRAHSIRLSTLRKYNGLLANLKTWLIKNGIERLPVGAFTSEHASHFFTYIRTERKLSNESYNSHLFMFRSFYNELVEEAVVKQNPFVGLRGLPSNSTAALYFKKVQTEHLKNEIPARDKELWKFIEFIYYCFIRPGEIRQLKVSDIIIDEHRIKVRSDVSKTNKMQYVSIPTQLMKTIHGMELNKYPDHYFVFSRRGGPGEKMLGVNNMKIRHRKILDDLKYSTQHKLYSWKHTGAIACSNAGMNLKDLQMQLRHHSLDQVNTYLADMQVHESQFIRHSYPSL